MAFLENVFKKSEGIDIEDFLNNLDSQEEDLYEDADAFVKPLSLVGDEDVELIVKEAKDGNIVLLNIADLSKRNAMKLKQLIGSVRDSVLEMNGDIARISEDRGLITPSNVKIIKARR